MTRLSEAAAAINEEVQNGGDIVRLRLPIANALIAICEQLDPGPMYRCSYCAASIPEGQAKFKVGGHEHIDADWSFSLIHG